MKSRPRHAPALAALIATAWSENAPDAKFAGMTLLEFQNATQPVNGKREALVALHTQRRAMQEERDLADKAAIDLIQRVVASVRADINYGPDAPLLAAMRYVTRSNRKSGLTRKTQASANAEPLVKSA